MKSRVLSTALVLLMVILPIKADARWSETKPETELAGALRLASNQATQNAQSLPPYTSFQSSPVMFIENVGQWNNKARFQVWGGPAGTMWLAEDAFWITVLEPGETNSRLDQARDPMLRWPSQESEDPAPRSGVNIKLSFVGANPQPRIETFNPQETTVSYFYGNNPEQWRPAVPVWGGVRYVDLYPGVDLEVTNEDGRMVQRLTTRLTSDLEAVRLRVEGADAVDVDGSQLRLNTNVGQLTLPLVRADARQVEGPKIEQGGTRLFEVASPFVPADTLWRKEDSGQASPSDNPASLIYSTFLGGSGYEWGDAIVVDWAHNTYVTGMTSSSDFPTTPGAFSGSYSGNSDAYVFKLNPTGGGPIFATFLGGSDYETGRSIAIDGAGNVYVSGDTASSNFPTTPGAYDRTYNGSNGTFYFVGDCFVAKLTPQGSGLTYASYLGGSGDDWVPNIVVDSAGNAFVAGKTSSTDFPTTPGALDTSYNGGDDAFVAKLNPTGSALTYATFLGGSGGDQGSGMALDTAGSAYVAGFTTSSNFPTTPGSYDTSHNGSFDAFVVKLNPTGSALAYATFLGGSSSNLGYDIAVDQTGFAYIIGSTGSVDFPTTANAFDRGYNGGNNDAFIAKLNPTGNGLAYSTFLGGSSEDYGFGITVDGSGNAFLTGFTTSNNFPTTVGAFDRSYNGSEDAFLAKLSSTSSRLFYSTFLGGSNREGGDAIAVDGTGKAYITGRTFSSDFPLTPGAFSQTFANSEAFVAKVVAVRRPPVVLVHGWKGSPANLLSFSEWRSCNRGDIESFDRSNLHHQDWIPIADELQAEGFMVYVAELDSRPSLIRNSTPRLEENALCLKQQIEQVASSRNKAVLITHSMGGLVSRAYMENSSLYRDTVEHLITLGTPHGGVNLAVLRKLFSLDLQSRICEYQPAVCQFSRDGVVRENERYRPRVTGTYYSLIGGISANMQAVIIAITEGPNDTSVGAVSAGGRYWPLGIAVANDNGLVGRYVTFANHSGYFGDSNTMACIKFRLGLGGDCSPLTERAESYGANELNLNGQTMDLTGTLTEGQAVNRVVPLDTTGMSVFMLNWMNGELSFALTNPAGLLITPAYAAAHPAEVSYSSSNATSETPAWASYTFTNTIPGLWTLAIGATSAPPEGTFYVTNVYMETDLQLFAGSDHTIYEIGETATFTATLSSASGGVTGAVVETIIARSDGVTETVQLASQGDGNYLGTYIVPDAPGLLFANVTATGTYDDLAFSRQRDLALSIASPYVSLTGQYTAHTPDVNGDGQFDSLLIEVGIAATRPTTITLSGSLVSAEVTRTLTAVTTAVINTGTQAVTLDFPGRSIHRLRGDGPYTLTDVVAEDLSVGGVLADTDRDAFVTAAYDHRQFGLRGDVDDSCEVDVEDVISIANAWHISGFDPVLDINRDGVITVVDIMLAAGNWGASCWP